MLHRGLGFFQISCPVFSPFEADLLAHKYLSNSVAIRGDPLLADNIL